MSASGDLLRDASVQLSDGRLLAFAEWGDPAGRPVLLCLRRRLWKALIVFGDRRVVFDSAGYAGRMDPETPADWVRSISE
jgi:hypothetical protein